MQYHLGVLRMLLFASFLVELKGIKASGTTNGSSSSSGNRKFKGYKAEMIKTLESRLLNIFSLKERPRPIGTAPVPEFMVELYRSQNLVHNQDKYSRPPSMERALATHQLHQGRPLHSAHANTVRSFIASNAVTETSLPEDAPTVASSLKETRLWFNVTSLPSEELLRAAQLRVFRLRRRRAGCGGGHANGRPRGDKNNPRAGNAQQNDPTTVAVGRHRNRTKTVVSKGGGGGAGSSVVVYLQAYDVIRPRRRVARSDNGNYVETEPLLRLIDTRVIDQDHDGWESLDVSPALRRWRNKPSDNHGLVLRLVSSDTGKVLNFKNKRCVPGLSDANAPLDRKPLLVTYTDDGRDQSLLRSARAKRNVRKSRKKKRPACRRHSLYVDFNDVGWNDWIVAPPGYNAFYCQGDCNFPLADNLNSTNHAIVQTLVNSANPSLVPRACCVPTELSPISMLYRDEYEKVVLKNYQDMVVEGCGCR